jgi:hypothetical protein
VKFVAVTAPKMACLQRNSSSEAFSKGDSLDNSLKQPKKPRAMLISLGLVGVLAAVILGHAIIKGSASKPEANRPRSPEDLAKPHLSKAEQECERVIDEHLKTLDGFFTESKKNTRGFAQDALGWGSKRRLIQDAIPFGNQDKHKEFLRNKFEERIFQSAQLEDAVKQVVKSYLAHVRSIESKMLVDLRTDAGDFPSAYLLTQLDDKRLQEKYDLALAKVQEDIASGIVTIITGEVLTQVAIRLGVRAGIVGVGVASGTVTFGIGLVVGLIVDQIVTFIWDWYSDPKGDLAVEINKKLDEMNRLLVDGSTDVKGLRERLREFAHERSATRSKAVISLLQPASGGVK